MGWQIVAHNAPREFCSLNTTLAVQGATVTQAKTRDLLRVECAGNIYYVKRYWTAGKRLRAYCLRSRVKAEWENLQYFNQLNIPTPALVAYGESRRLFQYQHGAFVMDALDNVVPLDVALADETLPYATRLSFLRQVATGLRRLHDHHFIHGDCYARNFLVSLPTTQLYFTDCPQGKHRWGPFFTYGRIRDLASFYKETKLLLSLPDQLRFFLWYQGESQLTPRSKILLQKIIRKVSQTRQA